MFLKNLVLSFCVSAAVAFAGAWSGSLVDSECFASVERNHNPTDTLTAVDQDTGEQIRYCAPSVKTKHFALVDSAGNVYRLDTAGDQRAQNFVRQGATANPLRVSIAGSLSGKTITVNTISKLK